MTFAFEIKKESIRILELYGRTDNGVGKADVVLAVNPDDVESCPAYLTPAQAIQLGERLMVIGHRLA